MVSLNATFQNFLSNSWDGRDRESLSFKVSRTDPIDADKKIQQARSVLFSGDRKFNSWRNNSWRNSFSDFSVTGESEEENSSPSAVEQVSLLFQDVRSDPWDFHDPKGKPSPQVSNYEALQDLTWLKCVYVLEKLASVTQSFTQTTDTQFKQEVFSLIKSFTLLKEAQSFQTTDPIFREQQQKILSILASISNDRDLYENFVVPLFRPVFKSDFHIQFLDEFWSVVERILRTQNLPNDEMLKPFIKSKVDEALQKDLGTEVQFLDAPTLIVLHEVLRQALDILKFDSSQLQSQTAFRGLSELQVSLFETYNYNDPQARKRYSHYNPYVIYANPPVQFTELFKVERVLDLALYSPDLSVSKIKSHAIEIDTVLTGVYRRLVGAADPEALEANAINTWSDEVALEIVLTAYSNLSQQALAVLERFPDTTIDLNAEILQKNLEDTRHRLEIRLAEVKLKAITLHLAQSYFNPKAVFSLDCQIDVAALNSNQKTELNADLQALRMLWGYLHRNRSFISSSYVHVSYLDSLLIEAENWLFLTNAMRDEDFSSKNLPQNFADFVSRFSGKFARLFDLPEGTKDFAHQIQRQIFPQGNEVMDVVRVGDLVDRDDGEYFQNDVTSELHKIDSQLALNEYLSFFLILQREIGFLRQGATLSESQTEQLFRLNDLSLFWIQKLKEKMKVK